MECVGSGAAAGTRPLMGHGAASAARKQEGSWPDADAVTRLWGRAGGRGAAANLHQQVSLKARVRV